MVVFLVFVWFMMKFVWLLLINVFDECLKKIVDGFVVVEKGKVEFDVVYKCVDQEFVQVCNDGQQCIVDVEKCVQVVVEEIKVNVQVEVVCIVVQVKVEVEQ